MNATVNFPAAGIVPAHRHEQHYCGGYIAVAITPEGVRECVDVKLYTTASRCYCCAWIFGAGHCSDGSAYAGGYGYHRASAAAGRALRAAGVSLSENIDGRGDSAIRDAVEAIARAMYPGCAVHIVHAHG